MSYKRSGDNIYRSLAEGGGIGGLLALMEFAGPQMNQALQNPVLMNMVLQQFAA